MKDEYIYRFYDEVKQNLDGDYKIILEPTRKIKEDWIEYDKVKWEMEEGISQLVEKLLKAEPMDVSPKLVIKNPTKNFYEFKVEDFEIQGYDYNKKVKIGKIPVAE